MLRSEYDRLNRFSNTFYLNIGDTTKADNVSTLKNLSIVNAQCVSRGLEESPDALYLVEITDPRGILHNKWFQFPLNAQYNIRTPAYPQTFHPGSMNSGTTWTWATMIRNIWETMTQFLGTWPGLPITPAGTPEGFWFTGVPAWKALNDILSHLGLTVACDLTQDGPFTIVVDGEDDAAFTALRNKYVTNLEDDLEWIDYGAGRLPGIVKVLFRKRYSVYGTEETVRYDSFQWSMAPAYTISVSAPAAYEGGIGTHYIWSDFTVRHDMNNDPLAEDIATATVIATERVTQYFKRVFSSGFMKGTYAGALPFTTGSAVDGVCWYQDRRSFNWQGWTTEVVNSPGATPWPEVWTDLFPQGGGGYGS